MELWFGSVIPGSQAYGLYRESFLNDTDWKIPFTLHTDASYKNLGAVIIQNNKHIEFISSILSNPQCNYATTEDELL